MNPTEEMLRWELEQARKQIADLRRVNTYLESRIAWLQETTET